MRMSEKCQINNKYNNNNSDNPLTDGGKNKEYRGTGGEKFKFYRPYCVMKNWASCR